MINLCLIETSSKFGKVEKKIITKFKILHDAKLNSAKIVQKTLVDFEKKPKETFKKIKFDKKKIIKVSK